MYIVSVFYKNRHGDQLSHCYVQSVAMCGVVLDMLISHYMAVSYIRRVTSGELHQVDQMTDTAVLSMATPGGIKDNITIYATCVYLREITSALF